MQQVLDHLPSFCVCGIAWLALVSVVPDEAKHQATKSLRAWCLADLAGAFRAPAVDVIIWFQCVDNSLLEFLEIAFLNILLIDAEPTWPCEQRLK